MDQAAQVIAALALLALGGLLVAQSLRHRRHVSCLAGVDRLFRVQREHLEAKFVDFAQPSHERRTSRSIQCDFEDDVTYVRSRRTGQVLALVAITVSVCSRSPFLDDVLGTASGGHSFVPPRDAGPFESVRSATAVFAFDGRRWTTDGSVILDLTPSEAVRRLGRDLQIVGKRETARV